MSVDRLPGWKRLFVELVERRLKPGDFIELEYVEQTLGIDRGSVRSMEEADRYDLALLRARKAFERLLIAENIDLEWQRRPDGWRVLTAQQQVDRAQRELRAAMSKAFAIGARRMVHIDTLQLTDSERAKHADQLAKQVALRSIVRSEMRQLPAPAKKGEEDK
jgi:hypothetical protein